MTITRSSGRGSMRPKLEHVRYVITRGKVYAYFNTGKKLRGRTVYARMPEPSSASFFQSYAAFKAARDSMGKQNHTFARMVAEYRKSDAYTKRISDGTRKTYRSILGAAEGLLGDFPTQVIDRPMIEMILEENEWGAGKQNLFVAVVGAVYKWGRANGKTDAHPTREIARAETGERMAWPDDVLEAGLAAGGRAGLAIALLLYTGQRIGDVCNMRWADIKGRSIRVTQQKTGKRLTIPLHGELLVELERHGKRGITLLTGESGKPIGTQPIRDEIKALAAKHGHPDLLPHGLRKNAVMALLRAGCSVAETAAITGQTYTLVEYYARQIDQERMAESAILKWEQSAPVQRLLKSAPQVTGK